MIKTQQSQGVNLGQPLELRGTRLADLQVERKKGVSGMLRITKTAEDSDTVTLKLEGKVTDDTASDLERLCLLYRDGENKTVFLDFQGVTFINGYGLEILERIKGERIKMVNGSLFVETLLRSLEE